MQLIHHYSNQNGHGSVELLGTLTSRRQLTSGNPYKQPKELFGKTKRRIAKKDNTRL